MFAAPTIVKRLVDHALATGADCSGFKTIVYGGAPMYAADIERAIELMGPCFVQIYGQGESPMVITALGRTHLADAAHPRHAQRLASVGVAQTPVDGFLTLKDRSKDVIISGGSNIYPREVEEVLLLAPGVAEASVVGMQDPEWGEVVVAFVVPRPGHTIDPSALDALCLEHIARFKRPKRYEIVDSLPKNNYGKVLKTALRERFKL
jgi:long-chain acyl-CoA synthetase